jgi:ketosteroid isomerase-like protein
LRESDAGWGDVVSEDHVQLAKRGYEAFLEGKLSAVVEMIHPSFVAHLPDGLPGTKRYEGQEGFLAGVREQLEAFDEWQLEPREFIAAGDRVLVLVHQHGRGRLSGVEVDVFTAWLWTFVDGKAVALRVFLDQEEAFRAIGRTDRASS